MTRNDEQAGAAAESTRAEEKLTRNGGITYLHIPASDVQRSADFYERVFGWSVSRRDRERASFSDTTGHLYGAWVTELAPAREPGLLPYIYVDALDEAVERVKAHGGEIVREPYPEGTLRIATFRDPAGNVLGLWQETQR